MQTGADLLTRWRYLRQLLRDQLAHIESGSLTMHAAGADVSEHSIQRLRREIEAFDGLIEHVERDAT